MGSKYQPLGDYLAGRQTSETPMSFAEIETVIGVPLPPKSTQYPAWWSNNPSNNPMTRVWLEAGYRTERVDIGGARLVFRRVGPARTASVEEPSAGFSFQARAAEPPGGFLARVRLALAGSVKVAPGVDLTAPLNEPWDEEPTQSRPAR